MLPWVVLIHVSATLFMVGLIWFVQVCHYPLFNTVGTEVFTQYEALHKRLTTCVVAPPMLLELATAVWLAFAPSAAPIRHVAYAGLALLTIVWLATLFLQVPQHEILARGFDPTAHARLVTSNWVRTVAWTARGLLGLGMVAILWRPVP